MGSQASSLLERGVLGSVGFVGEEGMSCGEASGSRGIKASGGVRGCGQCGLVGGQQSFGGHGRASPFKTASKGSEEALISYQ